MNGIRSKFNNVRKCSSQIIIRTSDILMLSYILNPWVNSIIIIHGIQYSYVENVRSSNETCILLTEPGRVTIVSL